MVKKILILILILIPVFGVVLWYKSRPLVFPAYNIKLEGDIVAFGDSLVEGYGVSGDDNFVSILSSRIGETIVNAGKSGDTSMSALNRLERDVLSRDPRLVMVLLGGNDTLRRISQNKTFSNLAKIIDLIQENNAYLLCCFFRPVSKTYPLNSAENFYI